ncbi:hypothetical protein PIB30_090279 [Stylosanthes scabra]|uniref:Protein kinase domain-containing protein n=1 Tax=Stylosanthes scabra TaxID=79078 RepID=A0ABU6UUX7_9FABA|nr:hypothetical protein [Stylosanthes scabra]
MAIFALLLVLLLQLSTIFGSAVTLRPKDCGTDWVAHSYSSEGEELFYINGNVVNKVAFCEALQLYITNDCELKDYFGSNNCAIDASFVNLPSIAGRKLLQKDLSSESESQGVSPKVGLLRVDANSVTEKVQVPASLLRVPPSPSRFSTSPKLKRIESLHLNLNQIARATCNFSETLQIGEGGFGTVYKAQLEDGHVVAVKRAKREHFESLRTEISNEVELLAKILYVWF